MRRARQRVIKAEVVMRTIRFRVHECRPSFYDMTAAINHALNHPRLAVAKADLAMIRGYTIRDCYWTDCQAVFVLERGRFLHVFADPKNDGADIDWEVTDREPTLAGVPRTVAASEIVLYECPRQKRNLRVDRSAVFKARIGGAINNLFANEAELSVYTEHPRMISLARVYDLDANHDVLYIYEDD